MEPHPIRLVVRDDLQRSRLTVFFRLLLAIPHLIWLWLWSSIALFPIAPIALDPDARARHACRGRSGTSTAALVRYTTHVYAYVFLAGEPVPGLHRARPAATRSTSRSTPPERQNRWKTLFRLILALPALYLATRPARLRRPRWRAYDAASDQELRVLRPSGASRSSSPPSPGSRASLSGACPRASATFSPTGSATGAQTWGYLLFLTDRYPDADTDEPAATQPTPAQPVRLRVEDDLRRSRLTVFFRLLLTIPHFVWLVLWSIAVFFALIVGWFAALVTGRLPDALHRFIAAYVRYATHVFAFLCLVGQPLPGVHGHGGELSGRPRDRARASAQSRWKTLFRLFLAIPAHLVASALVAPLELVAIFGWFVGLVLGRMPKGLRNLGAYCLRYSAQTYAYTYLLTDSLPLQRADGVRARRCRHGPARCGCPRSRRSGLAAVWALAAWWLWQTEVPAGLRPARRSTAARRPRRRRGSAEARDFERFLRWSFVASAHRPARRLRRSTRATASASRRSRRPGRIGTGMLLGMLGFAIVWLVQIPFGLLDLWWQRRHDVSELGYVDWLFLNWFALGGEFLFVCLALLIVMGLAGPLGNWWWIPGAAVFVGLALLFTFVSPYLIPEQVDPPARAPGGGGPARRGAGAAVRSRSGSRRWTRGRARTRPRPASARRAGSSSGTRSSTASTTTRCASSSATSSATIPATTCWKGIAWYALFALPGAFLIAWATRRRGGMRDPAAVPLALLRARRPPAPRSPRAERDHAATWRPRRTGSRSRRRGTPTSAAASGATSPSEALADPSPPTVVVLPLGHAPVDGEARRDGRGLAARQE